MKNIDKNVSIIIIILILNPHIRQILDVLRPVNRKGSYQDESKGIATTNKIPIHCLYNKFHCMIQEVSLGKKKLNELGRQKIVGLFVSLLNV